ncbi:MAG: LacI family DNA-binding transcriptional regulator [Bifidobacterium psychraerophilum]|uniref:LacI family DNA-binding transcriptional regulator n=1 Tax=Bifidobacterium psychraerophilum TaxID=218140 RepID=UPI0039ED5F0C
MAAVTMKEIAERTGVSVSSVSLVLNNRDMGRIKPDIASRIREEAKRLGYRPNRIASSMRTNRTRILGFISDEIATTPFAGRLILGAQDAARAFGYTLLTVNTNGEKALESSEIETLKQYGVDGFLYARMFNQRTSVPGTLRDYPLVLVDATDVEGELPSIVPDEVKIGKDITERLIDAGCRRIAYIGLDDDIAAQVGRFKGYRQALAERGLAFDERLVTNPVIGAEAMASTERLMDDLHPDGFFCFNDARAWGVYQAAAWHKLAVGKDLSVIGVDNHQVLAETLSPYLTTVELPHYEMGCWGTRKLISLIEDRDVSDVLPPPTRAVLPSLEDSEVKIACALVEKESVVGSGSMQTDK